jgi:NADH:ubiquinone oxidoreductase subunit E
MTIYPTRYQAYKARRYGEVVVKVCGGYAVMDAAAYRVWKKQK